MRPEHAAVTTAMLDYMPCLTQQGKLLEAESLSYEESRQVIQNICDYTKKLSDDFKGRAPRGSKWRAFVKEVESHGVKFKRTPGRDDAWIDRLLQRLADAIHEQHVRHLEDVEELAAECRLFDFVGAPEVLATSAELKAHYDPVLEVIFKQHCDGDGPSLDRDALERLAGQGLDRRCDNLAPHTVRVGGCHQPEQLAAGADEVSTLRPIVQRRVVRCEDTTEDSVDLLIRQGLGHASDLIDV